MAPLALEAVVFLCALVTTTLATMAVKPLPDGFSLEDFEPNKYFSYGIVPDRIGNDITLSFYDVNFTSSSCDDVNVEIQGDGYFKHDYHRLAIVCDVNNLSSYTVSSPKGFHIIVRTGDSATKGSLKARFTSNGSKRWNHSIDINESYE